VLLKILNGWLVTIPTAMLTAMVAYAVLIGFFVDASFAIKVAREKQDF